MSESKDDKAKRERAEKAAKEVLKRQAMEIKVRNDGLKKIQDKIKKEQEKRKK